MLCFKRPLRHAGVERQVRVKVTEVRDEGGGLPKVNCSMRAVDQETGEDLDPSGALVRGGGRPGGGGGGPRGPVSDAPPEVCTRGVELGTTQGLKWESACTALACVMQSGLGDGYCVRNKSSCCCLSSACI